MNAEAYRQVLDAVATAVTEELDDVRRLHADHMRLISNDCRHPHGHTFAGRCGTLVCIHCDRRA